MLRDLIERFTKNHNDKEDEYSCTMDEAGTADLLFIKLKKDLTESINKYGDNIEYVILCSDMNYSVLFSKGISRIRIFNRINYLLEKSMNYRMKYIPYKNSNIYGVGDKIIVNKIR